MSYSPGDVLPVNDFYWQSYTFTVGATVTNPAVGDSTRVGRYFRLGQLMIVRIALTIGSSFAPGSGVYLFSLPANAVGIVGGSGLMVDVSSGTVYGGVSVAIGTSAGNVQLIYGNTQVGASAPFVPANGDVYNITAIVEVA